MILILNFFIIVTTSLYCLMLFIFIIGLFFPNEKRQSKKYFVSVIIAARNEEKNIRYIINDLFNQTYPSQQYQVIIVDDHSTDETAEIVRNTASRYKNLLLIQSKKDETGKLNAKKNAIHQGILKSKGEIILMTDADCRVRSTWIESMVSYFEDKVGMVVGYSELGVKGEKRSLFEHLQAIDFLALLTAAQGSVNVNFPLAATGQNLAYRRSAFDEVGGFKEIGHRISGDDVLLLQLVYKKTKWKICFAPSNDAFNLSAPERTFQNFLNQRKRWASNGSYQFKLNRLFFIIVLNTFLVNLSVLLLSLISSMSSGVLFNCLCAKIFTEFVLILKGSRIYNRSDLVKYFPIWTIIQIPYVVVVGLFGNIGNFIWKERKHQRT